MIPIWYIFHKDPSIVNYLHRKWILSMGSYSNQQLFFDLPSTSRGMAFRFTSFLFVCWHDNGDSPSMTSLVVKELSVISIGGDGLDDDKWHRSLVPFHFHGPTSSSTQVKDGRRVCSAKPFHTLLTDEGALTSATDIIRCGGGYC